MARRAARLAAGAVLTAADYVIDNPAGSRAFKQRCGCWVITPRPIAPWASAFTTMAVGAARARRRASSAAIVDFDVHHGNGTQWIFYEDPSVLACVVASVSVLSRHGGSVRGRPG